MRFFKNLILAAFGFYILGIIAMLTIIAAALSVL